MQNNRNKWGLIDRLGKTIIPLTNKTPEEVKNKYSKATDLPYNSYGTYNNYEVVYIDKTTGNFSRIE